jgi:hypothetical protein
VLLTGVNGADLTRLYSVSILQKNIRKDCKIGV